MWSALVLIFTIISTVQSVKAVGLGAISLLESKSILLHPDPQIDLKEKILNTQDNHEDNKAPKSKKISIKMAAAPRIGPVTVKLDINPVNINQNQASLNLDLVESYDILTRKKDFTYETVDLKKLKRYVSLDTVNSLVETIKEEFSPVE